jgi:hypothetical protein
MGCEAAPVAVFAYRRAAHLDRALTALARCPEAGHTAITVFCDGARGDADRDDVAAVRARAHTTTGFGSVRVIERDANLGLAASVISGVGAILAEHERVVVVEDDLVVSPDFLRYCNDGLDLYAGDDAVASIHAYVYPTDESLPETFFLRGADCWGWATWARAWRHFDADGSALLRRLQDERLTSEFDFGGAFPYSQMLREQVAGRTDSWAIRWYASAFLDGMLTLYPGRSLVQNIGLDGSGTNSLGSRGLATAPAAIGRIERIPVEESPAARAVISRALAQQGARPLRWWHRLVPGR